MNKLWLGLILMVLSPAGILADDRTMRVGIFGFLGAPPTATILSVTTGSVSNQNPSAISFYVEYSDDLVDWKPFHIFDSTVTNTSPTIVTNQTNGQITLLLDETACVRRFYRAVEIH
jgi:hypothetical protein